MTRLRAASVCLGLLGSILVPAARPAIAAELVPLPKVMVIATGGTIAGVQKDPKDPDLYRSGSLTAEQIIASVPELERYARVQTLQFLNVSSSLITPAQDCEPIDKKGWQGPWIPTINAPHLTPQKARILLMLALARTRDYQEIREIFRRY